MSADLSPSGEELAATRLWSSGGVVVRDQGDRLQVALMRSRYGTWVFPKGEVEPGEDPSQAARREIREEIGLAGLDEIGALGSTEHCFERAGRRYVKRVDWFLFEAGPGVELRPSPTEGSLDCGWFGTKRALLMLSHSDQRRLLRRAMALVEHRQDGRLPSA